jgi:hypothetical protein
MLVRIISGGQTGVDQAALRAARACGLETGGWVRLGWATDDCPVPCLIPGRPFGPDEVLAVRARDEPGKPPAPSPPTGIEQGRAASLR